MVNENVKQLISDVERDLLFQIILNLRHGRLSAKEAQSLAQGFLKLLPPQDEEKLINQLGLLGQTYPEARQVYLKYVGPIKEEKYQQALAAIRNSIKEMGGEYGK